jgi:hypothetical protein
VPLRLKTTSLPVTVHGTVGGDGDWQVVVDTTDELRMQCVDASGQVIATLVASAPARAMPRAA